jgi:dihydrodipicolinate synthase/N-acetylneuraminate lyase
VSGLASALPELVAEVVADPSPEGGERLTAARKALSVAPTAAGLKRVLARRGMPVSGDMRAPLRPLTHEEERAVDSALDRLAQPVP